MEVERRQASEGNKVYYTNGTLAGMSGSPVLAETEGEKGTSLDVVGIHNGGVRIQPCINYGQTISSVIESAKEAALPWLQVTRL